MKKSFRENNKGQLRATDKRWAEKGVMAEASNEQSTDGQIFNETMTNGIHGRGYGARAAHANRVQRVERDASRWEAFPTRMSTMQGQGQFESCQILCLSGW